MPENQSSNAKRELTETNIVPGPPWHTFYLSLWRVLEGTGGLVSFCPPSGVFGHHCDPFGALFVAFMFCSAFFKNLWPTRAVRSILSTCLPCWKYAEIWFRRFSTYFQSCIFVTCLLHIYYMYIFSTYFLHILSFSPELKICKPVFPVR